MGEYFFQIMSEYDQTFDPNILIGHCDLFSRFSDFALYLDTQLVYFHTCMSIMLWVTGRVWPYVLTKVRSS